MDALCDHLVWMSQGEFRFMLVNMPPRTSKSLVTSVFWPVWSWIDHPELQFLTASYALQLSQRDALKSRRLIESPWFQRRYSDRFTFSWDEKLKRSYSNDKGGRRICLSTDSATTGEGGNRLIVDDPHNTREVESETIRKGCHDWWSHAMSNRMNQPEKDTWLINGQRTGEDDLFAHIERTNDMSTVVKLVLPNEYDSKLVKTVARPPRHPKTKKILFTDPRKKQGELLCPQRMGPSATKRMKLEMGDKYAFQYQQDPKGSPGRILKREHWRKWEGLEMPECNLIISVYDGAFEEGEENDYSARTDWGIFPHSELMEHEDTGELVRGPMRYCGIMIGAWREKVSYGGLKREARRHYIKVKPDKVLIEKKASGIVLAQDLRKRPNRMPVLAIRLDHGGRVKMDKVERAHLASSPLEEGLIYYADRPWAQEVIDECAAFPEGTYDDWVDTVTMALQYLRRMNELGKWEEEDENGEVRLFARKKGSVYG